jgi:hypothetical protein
MHVRPFGEDDSADNDDNRDVAEKLTLLCSNRDWARTFSSRCSAAPSEWNSF